MPGTFPTKVVAIPGIGLLAYGSSYSPGLPGLAASGSFRVSSPLTVAGPRRILTGFRLILGWDLHEG